MTEWLGGLGGRALGDHCVRQRDSRCHGPSRACPRPERLSREQEMWVREGNMATGKHLAIYSEGGAMEGLEQRPEGLPPGFQKDPSGSHVE